MRVPEAAGDDYRTSHGEVKWSNDLLLMNFRLRMSFENPKISPLMVLWDRLAGLFAGKEADDLLPSTLALGLERGDLLTEHGVNVRSGLSGRRPPQFFERIGSLAIVWLA